MIDIRDELARRAFKIVPGASYNEVLRSLNTAAHARDEGLLIYEMVHATGHSWEGFRDETYPPFVRYMESKGIDAESPVGVIVAVFSHEMCYLVRAPQFIALLRDLDRLNPPALHFQITRWRHSKETRLLATQAQSRQGGS